MSDITLILKRVEAGDPKAADQLLPLVYQELRRLAAHKMANEAAGHTLQPTALVHEAWLKLVGDANREYQGRDHFFAAAAEAMRRILIERARRKARLKRGGGVAPLNIEDFELAEATPDERVLLIDEALARLQAKDPERARVVVMKFFGGMTNEDAAQALGLNERTVRRQWNYARAWLLENIREQL